MPIDKARSELSKNKDLAAVIRAAESADARELLRLAVKVDGYCQGGRQLPPGCESRDSVVEAVYQDCGTRCVRSVSAMEEWLALTLQHGPVRLEFAARDKRLPEGDGGFYLLTFRATKPGFEEQYDGIGLVVRPGTPRPIEEFTFGAGPEGGLGFAQIKMSLVEPDTRLEDAVHNLLLIAPRTVASWRDIQHETATTTVAVPEAVIGSPEGEVPGVHDVGLQSGIPAVDAFLDRAYSGNLASLAKDAVFVPTRCGPSVDIPPCDSGDLPNTPYDVVGMYNCDKHFARSVNELEDGLKEIDREGRQFLLFVLAPERAPGPSREAAGEYIVGLRTASYPRRTFYLDEAGRLLTVSSCPGSYPNFSYGHVPAEAIIVGPP